MKKLIIALAASLGLASASFAGDFDNTQFSTKFVSGSLDFTLENTADNGLVEFNVGSYLYSYSMGEAYVDLYAELGYNRLEDTMNLRGEYQVGLPVGEVAGLYGVLAVDYVAATSDLGNGDFYFDPYVGASYLLSEKVFAFSEVGYTWNISDSWGETGGYVEAGIDYVANDRLVITPSLVRTFDTGEDSTQARLAATIQF